MKKTLVIVSKHISSIQNRKLKVVSTYEHHLIIKYEPHYKNHILLIRQPLLSFIIAEYVSGEVIVPECLLFTVQLSSDYTCSKSHKLETIDLDLNLKRTL